MRLVRLFLVLALALLPVFSFAVPPEQYNTSVSATQANTAVSFGFPAHTVLVVNDSTSANEVYIAFAATVAVATGTAASFRLEPGESVSVGPVMNVESPGRTGIGLICATGETATVRVLALR